jgi:hypothetical protein
MRQNRKVRSSYIFDPLGRIATKFDVSPIAAYILGVIVLGLIEQILIPYFGNYPKILSPDPGYTSNRISALIGGFVIAPFVWAFFVWTTKSHESLYNNLKNNKVFAVRALKKYSDWHNEYEALVAHRRATAIVVIVTIVAITLNIYGWLKDVDPWFGRQHKVHFVFAIITSTIQYYFYFWIVLREIIFAFWVNRLFKTLGKSIIVRVLHSDGAGGFGALGVHAGRLSFFIFFLGLQFVLYTILTILYGVQTTIYSISIYISWFFYIIFVPLSVLPFILPAHKAMKDYKDRELSKLSLKIENCLKPVLEAAGPNDTEAIDNAKKAQSYLDVRKLLEAEMPVWPFSTFTFRQFTATSVFPIISFIGSLLIDYYKK